MPAAAATFGQPRGYARGTTVPGTQAALGGASFAADVAAVGGVGGAGEVGAIGVVVRCLASDVVVVAVVVMAGGLCLRLVLGFALSFLVLGAAGMLACSFVWRLFDLISVSSGRLGDAVAVDEGWGGVSS